MSYSNVLDEIIDRHGEHLEMIEADDASIAMIQILCNVIEKERANTDFYKKFYDTYNSKTKGCNS